MTGKIWCNFWNCVFFSLVLWVLNGVYRQSNAEFLETSRNFYKTDNLSDHNNWRAPCSPQTEYWGNFLLCSSIMERTMMVKYYMEIFFCFLWTQWCTGLSMGINIYIFIPGEVLYHIYCHCKLCTICKVFNKINCS